MLTPYSSQDLGRVFDARALTRGRSLGLASAVAVQLEGDTIIGIVDDQGDRLNVCITPSLLGRRVVFDHHCTCGARGCAHLAAAAFAALDRFPVLRKPEQQTFFDQLVAAAPEKERQRVVFELAPGAPPCACPVTTMLVGERSGGISPTTPRDIASDETADASVRDLAYLLGDGTDARIRVSTGQVGELLDALARSGRARWHAGGRRLIPGENRMFTSASTVILPPGSSVIVDLTGPWLIDALTGAVGRIRIQAPAAVPKPELTRPPARTGPPDPPKRRSELPPYMSR